jgi:phenylacetate-coenzyme A ligase PaaK-like adenylate-forming protein
MHATFLSSFKRRTLQADAPFHELALEAYEFQSRANPVYRQYLGHLGVLGRKIQHLRDIPFMPIEFYKHHAILCEGLEAQQVFESSGTTGQRPSRHLMPDVAWYDRLSRLLFEQQYGPLAQYELLALLPSYLERQTSSLVQMAHHFMQYTGPASGFYLHDLEGLARQLEALQAGGRKVLLLGVTFALLDLAERFPQPLPQAIVMETGGMKGRREELLREEVHERLCAAFQVPAIHSEYGMTELTSQGYSQGGGQFRAGHTLQIWLRETNDPRAVHREPGRTGGINVVDLGNIDTCCFVETQDLGRLHGEGFEVLGRFDNSELRGCNLMAL